MARKRSTPVKKAPKASTQPSEAISDKRSKLLDEDPRFNPKLFEPTRKKLVPSTDADGHDYILLDVLTSAYLDRISELPHFALVTPTPETLPMEGFIIPIEEFGQPDAVLELQRRAETNESVGQKILRHRKNHALADPQLDIDGLTEATLSSLADEFIADATPFELPHEVLAIGLKVRGKLDADGDYTPDSRLLIYTGVLDTSKIEKWRSWRYINQFWFFRTWEALGLDRFNPDVGAYRGRKKLDSKKSVRLKISKHDFLLLAITFLFNYWERRIPDYGPRVVHLERLGCRHKLDAKTLWTYCAEAACEPQTRKQVINMLESVQSQAVRFFKKNPVALEEQKLSCNRTIKFFLPESKRKGK